MERSYNSVQRIVVKTAVKTVLILLGIIIGAFAVFSFSFPQHMASAMESIGSYDMAVKYSNLRYFYTKDVYDLARCFDNSVLADDADCIISYGERLKIDNRFDEVCASRNRYFGGRYDYKERVTTCLTTAYYADGQTDKAIEMAVEVSGKDSFPEGNLYIVLSHKIHNKKDAVAAGKLLVVLADVKYTSEQESNYNKVCSTLRGVANQTI